MFSTGSRNRISDLEGRLEQLERRMKRVKRRIRDPEEATPPGPPMGFSGSGGGS